VKTYGTIDEWIAHKPDAVLTNHRLMRPDLYSIQFFRKLEKPTAMFGTTYADREYTRQTFNGNGYVEHDKDGLETRQPMNYLASLVTASGSGGLVGLTDESANDPNWTEVDWYDGGIA